MVVEGFPDTSLGFAESVGDGLDRVARFVECCGLVDLSAGHWLEAGLDAVLSKDLHQAALGQAVLLAELVSGGTFAVGVDDLGDSVWREAVIDAARLCWRCAWRARGCGCEQFHEGSKLGGPAGDLKVFQEGRPGQG